ncbi:MAG: hypothetical protein ACRD3O_00555 [Terriglobia bacterium]
MGLLTAQLRQVLRRLGRSPMFTAIAIITLALGIGATSAIFSVVNGILLKPLPYPHPGRLVDVSFTTTSFDRRNLPISPADYLVFRGQSRTFQDIGIYDPGIKALGYTR